MNIAPSTPILLLWCLAAVAFVLTFVLVATRYGDLPEEIPIHFGFTGKADNWGGRILIWLLPFSMLLMAVFMIAIAPMAARDQPEYRWIPAAMALYIGVITLSITWRMIAVAMGRAKTLGWYTFAIILVPPLALTLHALRVAPRS